jgi:hypothetical protein
MHTSKRQIYQGYATIPARIRLNIVDEKEKISSDKQH